MFGGVDDDDYDDDYDDDAHCRHEDVKMLLAQGGVCRTECIQGKCNVTGTLFLSFYYFLW